jgi:hypothetical protein
MKLVVAQLDALGGYVSREFYFIIEELLTTYGWRQLDPYKLWARTWDGAATIKGQLLEEFGELPEAILFWEGYNFLAAHAHEIARMECRKYIFADDLHWWDAGMRRERLVGFGLCETVLSTYAYVWDNFYPEFCRTKKLVWVPHSASPDFMLDYNQSPENSILLSGAINLSYPLRSELKLLHERRLYPIAHLDHPGYLRSYDHDESAEVGRGYAENINRHRAGFTDSLVYKYVVAKYFEIPATGALLLADDAVRRPLGALGFTANEHYLPVSKENLEERVRYVLDESNHKELDAIRRRGQELIRAKHKTSDRARQIDETCRG